MVKRLSFLSAVRWAGTAGLLLAGHIGELNAQAVSAQSILSSAKVKEVAVDIQNTMNFDSCLDFKVEACMGKCKGVPTPGIRFKYKEPTALVEVSCRHGTSELNKNATPGISQLAGSLASPNQQTCIEPIKTGKGDYRRWYYDVHVFGISPLARYKSSATTRQATASLTCGIFGAAGFLTDLSAVASNFDPANLAQSLNPANLANNIGQAVQNTVNGVANLPQSVVDGVTQQVNGLASLPQNIGSSLSGVMSGVGGLSGLNATDIGGLGSSLSQIAGVPGADMIPGMSSLGMAGNLLSGAGTGLTQLSSGLGDPAALGTQITGQIQQAGNAVQDFSIAAGTGINSSVGGLGAVNLSSGGIGHAGLGQAGAQLASNDRSDILSDASGGLLLSAPDDGFQQLAQLNQRANTKTKAFTVNTAMGEFSTASVNGEGESAVEFSLTGEWLTGSSQQALQTSQELYLRLTDALQNGSAAFLNQVNQLAKTLVTDTSSHCETYRLVQQNNLKVANILESLPQYQTDAALRSGPFIPRGTYLSADNVQVVDPDKPAASCPLNHAGYIYRAAPRTLAGYTTSMVNCHEVCKEENGETKCHWAPLPGYGGNCFTNPISKVKVNGKYPACHGQMPKLVANSEGDMVRALGGYRQNLDHVRALNLQLVNGLGTAARTAAQNLQTALGIIAPLAKQTPGGCADSALHIPTPTLQAVNFAQPNSKDYSNLLISPDNAAYKSMQSSLGSAATADLTSQAGLQQVDSMLGTADALMQQGGLQQLGTNMVGKYAPLGLIPVFQSENTMWSQPPVSIQSAIGGAVNSIAANSPLYLLCTAPQMASDFGAGTDSLGFTKKYCMGTWGLMQPQTGWAHNELRPVAAALIGARGHDKAVDLKGVQPNTKGTQQFNLDYPLLYTASPFAKDAGFSLTPRGGKHKGSGCYDVGTSKQGWFNGQEKEAYDPSAYIPNLKSVMNPNLQADIQKGYYVFTYWKRTSCCVAPCAASPGGINITREY